MREEGLLAGLAVPGLKVGNMSGSKPCISVVISCYNNWATLEKCLWALEVQEDGDFEVVLADDGSGEVFGAALDQYLAGSPLAVRRVWHEDDGFRKAAILNRAVAEANGEYILFLDGDILARADWVGAHRKLARRRRFLAGGSHVNLPESFHVHLAREPVQEQRVFDGDWLEAQGVEGMRRYRRRLQSRGFCSQIMDTITPRKDSFVGCNASCWREDFHAVGGFDETFIYGGVDRDLGIRLANAGVRGIRRRYSLAVVHLDHKRPYRDEAVTRKQKALLRERRRSGQVEPGHRQ